MYQQIQSKCMLDNNSKGKVNVTEEFKMLGVIQHVNSDFFFYIFVLFRGIILPFVYTFTKSLFLTTKTFPCYLKVLIRQ